MKRTLLMGAALVLAVSGCGGQDVPAEDDAPALDENEVEDRSLAEGDVQVLNFHGDENGFDDQRPEDYVIGHSTTFADMEWDEWGEERAHGEGEVLGTWCMDQGCQDDPYEIEVELGDPVEVDGTPYFSTFVITEYDEDMPQEHREALKEAEDGRLGVPAEPE